METRREGSPVNIVVADHDTNWMMEATQDLQMHPQVKVIGFAQTAKGAVERAASMAADAVLIEYAMPDMTAAEAARKLAEDSPGTAVFAVSHSITGQLVRTAQSAGVVKVFPHGDDFVAREVSETIVNYVEELRREWADADKKGIVECGTGPRGERIKKEYVTRSVTQSVVLTHNLKGGVGKSTIAINLAVAVKMSPYLSGQRVALIDFDCGGSNVSTLCNIPDNDAYSRNISMWEQVPEDLSAKEVDDLLIPGPKGIMVGAAPLNPAVSSRVTIDLADKILRILKRCFGFIVIDGAPNISPPVDAAMHHATHVLLVANPEGQAVKQLARIVDLCTPDPDYPSQRDASDLLKKMFVVLNHAQADTPWDLSPKEIASIVKRPIIAEIPNSKLVKQALHGKMQKQAVEMDAADPFVAAIKNLSNFICGAYPEGEVQSKPAKKGLFARLFGRG